MSNSLDRQNTQAVLRRALELADLPVSNPIPDLPRESLAEIAAELNIPNRALAAALAEHAVGAHLEQDSVLDRLIGPDLVWAQRTATGDPIETAEAAQRWLESGHGLKARITADGTVVATKRTDLVAKVKNQLRQFQGMGGLAGTRRVSASAIGFQEGRGAICIAADVGDKRNEALLGGAAVAVAGGAVAVAVSVVASPLAIIGLPLAAGLGLITSRVSYQSTVRKITESLEETVDGVVRGDRAPSVLDPVRKHYRAPWKQPD